MRAVPRSSRPVLAAAFFASLLLGCTADTTPVGGPPPPPPPPGAPTLSSLTPTSGPAAGGTVVTLTGTGFQGGAAVTFGVAAATSVSVDSATQITAHTPAAAAGAVAVTVTNPDAQSATLSGAFNYQAAPPPAPTLTSVLPTSGSTAGGTPVSVVGTGFRAGVALSFGGAAATAVALVSGTQLTAMTPAGAAGAVAVTVTNSDAQAATLPAAFTYVATPPPAPTLTAIAPTSGSTGGGTLVTLTGTGFRAGAAVTFGAAAASAVTVVSATRVTARTPAAAAGAVAVTLTNSDAQAATLPGAYTYAVPPALPDCATAPLTGTPVYYVCDCKAGAQSGCVAGADSNAGTSMAAPWQTWAKARTQFQSMAAGGTVAFCKGGSWTGAGETAEWSNGVQNKNCTAASPCTMRDYQASWGGTVRPRLKLPVGGVIMTLGWYQNYTASNLIHGLRFWNLEFVGSSSDGRNAAEFGFYFEGGVSDVDLCNLEIHHGIKQPFRFVTTSSLARFQIRGNDVHDNLGDIAMVAGGCSDLTVEGNRFDRTGGDSKFDHAIYINGDPGETRCFFVSGDPSFSNGVAPYTSAMAPVSTGYGTLCPMQRILIKKNVITNTALANPGKCMGAALVMHDAVDGLVVDGNTVAEPLYTPDPGCYGIAFGAGGETIRITGLVIRNNLVFGMGGNGIAASGAPGAIIENNLVAGGPLLTTCIAYPEQPTSAGNGDLASSAGRVRNNTCYLPNGSDGSAAIWGVSEGTGHVYANNAVVTTSGSFCLGTPGNPGGDTLNLPSGSTVTGNLCSNSGAGPGWWVAPGLSYTTANFHPAAGSPLLGAGTAAQAPATDLTGAARGNPPTVGAYEH